MDDRLSELQPAFEMSRLPTSLAHRKYWMSSVWPNWLLFVLPLVFPGVLSQPYYDNWMKFVSDVCCYQSHLILSFHGVVLFTQ